MPQEKKRLTVAAIPGGPSNDFFDATPASPGLVEVVHGTFSERLPAAEMTVAEVRARFADRLDIHPGAQARIDGHPVSDDTTLRAGQLVNFVRPSRMRRPRSKRSSSAPSLRAPQFRARTRKARSDCQSGPV